MTSTPASPLRLEAPRLVADAALGEHLAALARVSMPSAASPVRHSGWKAPLAAVAMIAASGGVAYAGQAALSDRITIRPAAVPANPVLPPPSAGPSKANRAAASAARAAPHGKMVGRGHPKTGKAKGHPGQHDAGNHGWKNPHKVARSIAHSTLSTWRTSAGSAGDSSP